MSSWKYLAKSSVLYNFLNETLVVIIAVKTVKEIPLLKHLWGIAMHSLSQAYMEVDK